MPTTAAIQVHIDLSTLNLVPVEPTPCPYYEGQDFATKAIAAYEQILLALDEEERVESLVHAFYLGALLRKTTRKQLTELRSKMPRHYVDASLRLHQLFEPLGVTHMYCTTWTTINKIKKLSADDYD
ncbi:11480_t:CDS:1, partial [Dentiscutata heterogama]